MLDDIRQKLAIHTPIELDPAHEKRDQAAVLVPVVTRREPTILFTERAGALANHGGEVSFPGGRADPEDHSLTYTALRENEEELGVGPRHVEVVGSLRPFISKYGLLVTPYVGLMSPTADLNPNRDEVASVFEVPVTWFGDAKPARVDRIARHGETHDVRVYEYDGYEIWGLTAMILAEFLSVVEKASGGTIRR